LRGLLSWSRWRRRHQHRATTCHRRWNEITAAVTMSTKITIYNCRD